MFNKVGQHIWRDLGPFLHAEPFKILHILRFALMDCPLQFRPHVFDIGFKSGDWDGHCKTLILFSQNHFCVDFEVCLGSLSCWKVHLWPSLSFLAEATRFLAKMSWYLVEFITPLVLTRAPGATGSKAATKHQWSTTIFEGSYEVLFLVCIPLLMPNIAWCFSFSINVEKQMVSSYPSHTTPIPMKLGRCVKHK